MFAGIADRRRGVPAAFDGGGIIGSGTRRTVERLRELPANGCGDGGGESGGADGRRNFRTSDRPDAGRGARLPDRLADGLPELPNR